ncbi:hypothetical protein ACP275_02G136300 [Erythranthe tilingii]
MELGLSLGDVSEPYGFLKKNNQQQKPISKKSGTLDFCMDLGLKSPAVVGNQETEKSEDGGGDGDDDGGDEDDGGNESDDDDDDQGGEETTPLKLSLVPFAPPQISSHLPWSSDNGSSENGSSGNMGMRPGRIGFDVNRPAAAAAEEVSSTTNSMGGCGGSPFGHHLGFNMYRNTATGNPQPRGQKRDLESAAGSDGAEAERTSSPRATSDDDENALNARKKLRLSKEQSVFLEDSFKEHNTLNPKQKLALAKQLNLRPRQVEVWFQNRRARTKLKQTEVDCEYLKRCCETLTEENRRLQKELQELRSLKTSSNNPFYMQLPATTLTMCPSCERVASTPAPAAAAVDSAAAPKAVPFPVTRPRFYPFSQSPTRHNHQPAAS